ncbi:hypothetical protein CEP52_000071 [Fusarium oligoseptatum]|uniref:Protein kinase domain-containing protein n=1 Tax=Fusarium oligoseptatum TaxID=2604345 RepID=A0A428UQN3_9HYPO|nr:hypothetical protein CEP52_000071 [Fusarium oligoseptatum]
MMHSASECHPDLHSIDCVGYVDDSSHSRYGLVYKAPSPSFSTLHELIASPDLKTPDLDDRVRLAHTLAVALWSLHSLDWLHKSLCSANILFFPSAFFNLGSLTHRCCRFGSRYSTAVSHGFRRLASRFLTRPYPSPHAIPPSPPYTDTQPHYEVSHTASPWMFIA